MPEEKRDEILGKEKELDESELDAVNGASGCICVGVGNGMNKCICVAGGYGEGDDDKDLCVCPLAGGGKL